MSIKYVKTHPLAKISTPSLKDDVGANIVALTIQKKLSPTTTLYNTHCIVEPPEGYYIEVVPRSSIVKTGYILANSVGIIDPGYRGEVMIALTKVDPKAPPLELPFTLCQLVLRKRNPFTVEVVTNLGDTERGDGGFGSTNNK
jgi:deoxyuridine 5'-triphosphate nucleotidohydrolase